MSELKEMLIHMKEIKNLLNLTLNCLIAMSNGQQIEIHEKEGGVELRVKGQGNLTFHGKRVN